MQFIDRKVPSVMLGHSPDYTHHTSDDTPDRVDPVELERSELVAAGAVLYLASLTEAEALDLVDAVAAESVQRVAEAARSGRSLLGGGGSSELSPPGEADNLVSHVGSQQREAVASVLAFRDTPAVEDAVEAWSTRLRDLEASLRMELSAGIPGDPGALRSPVDDRVPVRTTRGPLAFDLPASGLDAAAASWYGSAGFPLSGDVRFELVNFIDGERTVTGIRDALSAEFGPLPTAAVSRYVDDLVRVGVAEWSATD